MIFYFLRRIVLCSERALYSIMIDRLIDVLSLFACIEFLRYFFFFIDYNDVGATYPTLTRLGGQEVMLNTKKLHTVMQM